MISKRFYPPKYQPAEVAAVWLAGIRFKAAITGGVSKMVVPKHTADVAAMPAPLTNPPDTKAVAPIEPANAV
jgi:hypothetical protein